MGCRLPVYSGSQEVQERQISAKEQRPSDPAFPYLLQWHSSGHKGKSIQALTKRHFGDCRHGANQCWLWWQPVSGAVNDSGCATTYVQEELREPWLCWYVPRPSSHPDSLTTAVDQQEQHQQCQSSPTKPLRFWCTRIRPGGREGHQASTL